MKKIKLYNTLTKEVKGIKPINGDTFRIYSCGPTVYNNLHIGNLATQIREDVLKRVLKAAGYNVSHAMNITDVEDKIIRDSKKPEFWVEDNPMQSLLNLTEKYDQVFREDIAKIGNDVRSIRFIKATDTIYEMLNLINKLFENGIAYKAVDGVYFSIEKYLESGYKYGLLQNIDLSSSRERIKNDEYEKDSAADFALWKAQSEGEPAWEAKFIDSDGLEFSMNGRPGWHIECSAMSQVVLGVPFDIHTGGIDLKFPHHENEIAQSCGALKLNDFAKTFVHMNHIMVDGRKMSKSLNNFYTLRDIEEKGFSPQAFRLLVLSGHYQNETNFSWDILEAAQNRLNNWKSIIGSYNHQFPSSISGSEELVGIEGAYSMASDSIGMTGVKAVPMNGPPGIGDSITVDTGTFSGAFVNHFMSPMLLNLNTPKTISNIDSVVKLINTNIVECPYLVYVAKSVLLDVKQWLGIDLSVDDISDKQKELIAKRAEARANKDWAESDKIRDLLLEQGIKLKDTKKGQVWSRS